jgi:hypothetical protein
VTAVTAAISGGVSMTRVDVVSEEGGSEWLRIVTRLFGVAIKEGVAVVEYKMLEA